MVHCFSLIERFLQFLHLHLLQLELLANVDKNLSGQWSREQAKDSVKFQTNKS